MRALCGAIIAAGALIGLGLTSMGIGNRYAYDPATTVVKTDSDDDKGKQPEKQPFMVRLSQMDRPLVFILVFQTGTAVVGLGIAFVGLAYHHHRRHREHQWERERAALQQRTTV